MARRTAIAGIVLATAMLPVGCATVHVPDAVRASDAVAQPPSLRLAPSALPGGLALQQRLTFVRDGQRATVDALVEAGRAYAASHPGFFGAEIEL